jgi:hypothetical protein
LNHPSGGEREHCLRFDLLVRERQPLLHDADLRRARVRKNPRLNRVSVSARARGGAGGAPAWSTRRARR